MKKPNITEGPWKVNRYHGLGQWSCENPNEIHIEEPHGLAIASIDPYGTGDDTEMGNANAKAISAVPEMIEALIEVKKIIGDDPYPYEEEMMKKVDVALQKAGIPINEKAE